MVVPRRGQAAGNTGELTSLWSQFVDFFRTAVSIVDEPSASHSTARSKTAKKATKAARELKPMAGGLVNRKTHLKNGAVLTPDRASGRLVSVRD
jgi:hypothetical protein